MTEAYLPADTERSEVLTRERCYILELLNDAAVPQTSLARCRVEPGIMTELHRLAVDEWYVVRAGRGRMEVGGEAPFAVRTGDAVTIPAGISQRILNVGSEDLVFLCICVPRFTPQCYESLESG